MRRRGEASGARETVPKGDPEVGNGCDAVCPAPFRGSSGKELPSEPGGRIGGREEEGLPPPRPWAVPPASLPSELEEGKGMDPFLLVSVGLAGKGRMENSPLSPSLPFPS